ncbi:MAG: GNAT family N-acetyltransferase [Verrucomicrobia bacterium]|nr:GNAT family N-acetyltransferase [Verrucomicrobiota bacterium]MDE3098030.1 GNAT family N-acetyltransferase [Verrucomicrobiota bacterium]
MVTVKPFQTAGTVARFSAELEDPQWDAFLESTPLGHFQQSALWARAKQIEGWRPIRVIFTETNRIVGGFQILTKDTRFGPIGYVSKGPVVLHAAGAADADVAGLMDMALDAVVSTAKNHRLRALVLQPPDALAIPAPLLHRHRFLSNHLITVISATLVMDTACPMDDIISRIRKTAKIELRQSQKRGITIRDGHERDIPVFFRLMRATCERQHTVPSPSTEAALLATWRAFHAAGRIRLSFAEYQGTPIAGALCLSFGGRLTLWKKGWSGQHRDRHPNQAVMFDAIQWAHHHRHKLFDCAAMHPRTALALLNGQPLSENQKKGRDFFLLGYGGKPVLLPDSSLFIQNPALRSLYKTATAIPLARKFTKSILASLPDRGQGA